MSNNGYFMEHLKREFERLRAVESARFSEQDAVRVDIHCHDKNSDVPDERMARMLRWPETWVSTESVHACIVKNGALPLTMTNHNNARSCFELLDKGMDQLVGAEFTCDMPEFDIKLHVLTYGFTPAEETVLNQRRKNIYQFLEYARERDLVTVLAHPLFFYHSGPLPPFRYLERLMLMFDNIEVWNGQRDAWQNLSAAIYTTSLDEESILEISKREQLAPHTFCRTPFKKNLTGGSDCHMALFAGSAGTRFHVPGLTEKRRDTPLSRLVLDSFKRGDFSWFGTFASETKLTAALLDFFCQAVQHGEDPGLLRLLLHKGEASEKLGALAVLNGVAELRRHKYTARFLMTVHGALHGKRPGFLVRRMTRVEYRPLIAELDRIALASRRGGSQFTEAVHVGIPNLASGLFGVLAEKVNKNISGATRMDLGDREGIAWILDRLECPAVLRSLLTSKGEGEVASRDAGGLELLDGLPFPALGAAFLGTALFAGAKAMHTNRGILDELSKRNGTLAHPNRVLWLTDTLFDRNGVSTSLRLMLDEIKKRDLPIDIAITATNALVDDHLVVLRPLLTFTPGMYKSQPIRIPDLTDLHALFAEKRYDRIVCSTEGPMGLLALYLKAAFSIPAYFYLHTDWIDFAARTLSFDKQAVDRLRRLLRAYYKKFDGIFVLNDEHADFLKSSEMGLDERCLFKTAHWPKALFRPAPTVKYQLFPNARADTPVLFYAGRISEEKGVMELPEIYLEVRRQIPNALLAVAGDGPALEKLKRKMPYAFFAGWVNDALLAKMYAAADVLLLPSRFDTFGNVVLEAHACGLPAVAYNTKGPRDIIANGITGYLVETKQEMAAAVVRMLTEPRLRREMRKNAIERAAGYVAEDILTDLLQKLGLGSGPLIEEFIDKRASGL